MNRQHHRHELHLHSEKVDLNIPASAVPFTLKEASWSSAALILYCVQLRILIAPEHDKVKARADFKLLKKHDYMKIFRYIRTMEESNYKFIEAWEVFNKMTRQRDQYVLEKRTELIADVASTLSRKIY